MTEPRDKANTARDLEREPEESADLQDLDVDAEAADDVVGGLRMKAVQRDPTVAGQ